MPDDEQKKDDPKPASVEDEAPVVPEDKFRPEAIAARVEGLGQETDLDRVAREEEKKLLERKKEKKGKKGLESAASRRLAKIGQTKVKRPAFGADAVSPDADPLLERAARMSRWLQQHRQTFAGVVAVAVLGGAGAVGYVYWQSRQQADASVILSQGFADEHGRVSAKDDDEDQENAPRQLYPTFKTTAERRDAALAKYRGVEAKYSGTGAAILARLAEAGLLLDASDGSGARGAYQDVKGSALAQADAEVRGRALEGIGFADEMLARTDEANKDKHLDDALASFKALADVDMKGFKELGEYHQARVLQAKGDKPKAIELLREVDKRVTEPGDAHPFAYLEYVVDDRLRELDPTALPPKANPKTGGRESDYDTGDPELNARLQEMLRQMQQKDGGAAGAPARAPQ